MNPASSGDECSTITTLVHGMLSIDFSDVTTELLGCHVSQWSSEGAKCAPHSSSHGKKLTFGEVSIHGDIITREIMPQQLPVDIFPTRLCDLYLKKAMDLYSLVCPM